MKGFWEFCKRFKYIFGIIIAIIIGAGTVLGAIEKIKESKYRPVIVTELNEQRIHIFEKIEKDIDGLTLDVIAGNLERWDNKVQGLEAQRYQVWKDEKKLGPTPEIQSRKRKLERNIQKLNKTIKNEESKQESINKRRGR